MSAELTPIRITAPVLIATSLDLQDCIPAKDCVHAELRRLARDSEVCLPAVPICHGAPQGL